MNSTAPSPTPPEEEGPCGDWTYHEWAEASSTNDLARSLPPRHIAVCRVQKSGRGRFNRKWVGNESSDRYIIEDDYDSEFRMNGHRARSLYPYCKLPLGSVTT